MPIYGDTLTFKEPTADQVPLNEALVSIIRQHHQKSREHLFHLCMIAYGLRRHNLISNRGKRGGNAQDKAFKPQFKAWYAQNKLDEFYGNLSNFEHYAMGGRLLSYIAWQVDKKYIDRLPSSLTGLYACSQILWTQGGTTTKERKNYFYGLITKRIKDGSSIYSTSIHKQATRSQIEELNIFNEKHKHKKFASKKTSTKESKKIATELIRIEVSNDLFCFTNTGTKRGHLKLEEVEKFHQAIHTLIERYNKGKKHYSFQSNLPELKEKYKKSETPNFGAAILEADKKSKISARESAAKKATRR